MNTPPTRLLFIDWLRIAAFALLIPYHVGMYYVSWGWHVKNPEIHSAVEPFMLLSNPWRMGLLFLIGGVAASQLMGKLQSRSRFVRERSSRLLWPLLFGMAVVVPIQPYLEVVQKVGYAGSYLDFLGLYFQAYHGFCEGNKCLDLPTWNHLWFLPYLWSYCLLAAALAGPLARWGQVLQNGLLGRRAALWLLGLCLPLMAARCLLSLFPTTHNFTWDWSNHLASLWLFLVGWMAASQAPALWTWAERLRWPALAAFLLGWAGFIAYLGYYEHRELPAAVLYTQRVLYGLMQGSALLAMLGLARHHLDREHPWRAGLGAAIFCAYVLHQSVIVGLTALLEPLHLPDSIEALLLITLTALACVVVYLLARPVPGLRRLLGIAAPSSRAVRANPAARVPGAIPAR
ncbi:acyltransferase family protein [Roseateles sp. DB2]|uniref:acyltransferase family protein n=1 Tax=Roseateles sp. DB2 TaxID=3453717 RepID=UPI003EED23CC